MPGGERGGAAATRSEQRTDGMGVDVGNDGLVEGGIWNAVRIEWFVRMSVGYPSRRS
jgi:hypothetical protein